jgi:hypothetical protein
MHLDYMYCSQGPLIKFDSNLEHLKVCKLRNKMATEQCQY